MSTKLKNSKKALDSISIEEAYQDFLLSRKAKLCSDGMIKVYEFCLKRFLDFLSRQKITYVENIQAKHVRAFISELADKKLSDSYIHGYARNIKTMLRFFFQEKYCSELIVFDMPKVGKKQLSFLQPEQLPVVIKACENARDKALIFFMIDTGLRRAELCNLHWGDINIETGIVFILKGKGNKSRSVVIGVKTRRALLAYGRTVKKSDKDPLFQTISGKRLTPMGLRSLLLRLSNKTGIQISPHSLRRTFATLCYRAEMSLVDIQGLMGHSSLEMTRDYIQALTNDYIEGHRKHGPIDTFL